MGASLPTNIDWALQQNSYIKAALIAKYPLGHTYWSYLDQLVLDLRKASCSGVQEKIADVDSLNKFESAHSELEIARLLSARGKQVQLLPDSYLGQSPSPDLLVTDSSGQAYVEVTRFNEDEFLSIVLDELRQFLKIQSRPYQVDVDIPDALSLPSIGYRSMREKKEKARTVMEKFKTAFSSGGVPSEQITVDEVTFSVSESSRSQGGPGLINSAAIIVPSHQYVGRIRYLVTWKAEKRESWTGDHRKKWYFVAIDTEQTFLEEDDVIQAVLGHSVTERIIPLNEVQMAAKKGWGQFLDQVHLTPKDRTYLATAGAYLSQPICKNVSGLIVRKGQNVWFVPNPFATDEINDSRLVSYL
jgi:hypothetical protein